MSCSLKKLVFLKKKKKEIALTDFDFLLRLAQNCKICTFLDYLQTITQEENMKTRQVTPFFHLLFLLVCNIHFCI